MKAAMQRSRHICRLGWQCAGAELSGRTRELCKLSLLYAHVTNKNPVILPKSILGITVYRSYPVVPGK
jgi:hypothetical protein